MYLFISFRIFAYCNFVGFLLCVGTFSFFYSKSNCTIILDEFLQDVFGRTIAKVWKERLTFGSAHPYWFRFQFESNYDILKTIVESICNVDLSVTDNKTRARHFEAFKVLTIVCIKQAFWLESEDVMFMQTLFIILLFISCFGS